MSRKRQTISLSKHLGVSRRTLEKNGIFDATLGVDTKLFIDPKLLVGSRIPEFRQSRYKILKYFAQIIRVHKLSSNSAQLRSVAHGMLAVREPQGLAIGYGHTTDRGIAISHSVADRILGAISEVLSIGIQDKELIELMALFVDGFASDSISDLSAHIIYGDMCAYTMRLAKKMKVKETKDFQISGSTYKLPKHPFKDSQIIFVPLSLLSPLPVAVSWDEIAAAAAHNNHLRKTFGDIVKPVIYEALQDIQNQTPDVIKEVRRGLQKLVDVYQGIKVDPYNLQTDPKGYYAIQPFADAEEGKYVSSKQPKKLEELIVSVRELIKQYQASIEQNAGNRLLYRRTTTGRLLTDQPHNEDVAQTLFYVLADLWCSSADILLSREPNAGLGPVDFSLGTGHSTKVLVEIKKSNNKDLENGYKKQIAAYTKSESAKHSFFVVIVVREGKKRKEDYPPQLVSIQNLYQKNSKDGIRTPELIIIDGLIHPSPSKLR